MAEERPPAIDLDAFTCPECGAYAQQYWYDNPRGHNGTRGHLDFPSLKVAVCQKCSSLTLWLDAMLVHPDVASAPMPNEDMPEGISKDYLEARSISPKSPRGAAALLRLCIQKLCVHLGEPGENLNSDIGALVKAGLLPGVQKALDAVRVIGNNAVHPGEDDLTDTPEMTSVLFGLVNAITEQMITHPRQVHELYASLPEGARAAIENRDAK